MPTSKDTLVEIHRSEWPKLRDLYADKEFYRISYTLIQTAINYIEQNPQVKLHIYSLNGDWQQDGTFFMNDQNDITFNTLSSSYDRILNGLSCVDSYRDIYFYAFPEHFLPTIKQYFINHDISLDAFKPIGTFVYHATKEQIQQFKIDLPAGITVAPLQVQHAEQVNSMWPHKGPETAKLVERLIRYNPSCGAFNGDGQLMAWTMQLPTGCLGILQVLDEYKRQGLGSLMVRCLSKQLIAKNFEVFAPVLFENVASRALFEGLGFCVVDKMYWVKRPGQEKKVLI